MKTSMSYPIKSDRVIDGPSLRIGSNSIPIIHRASILPNDSELDAKIQHLRPLLLQELEHLKILVESKQRMLYRQRRNLDLVIQTLLDKRSPDHRSIENPSDKDGSSSIRQERRERVRNTAQFNLWERVDQFYNSIPTDAEIESIFADRLNTVSLPDIPEGMHWSQRLGTIARMTDDRLLMPPAPRVKSEAISSYWLQNPPSFQVEKSQKRNSSMMHCLLAALVETDPEPAPESAPPLGDEPVKAVQLLPEIEFDPYLSQDFESRLRLELEGAGLESHDPEDAGDKFSTEIKELRDQIENHLKPALDAYLSEVKEKLPEMRREQARYRDDQAIYRTLLNERGFRRKKRN